MVKAAEGYRTGPRKSYQYFPASVRGRKPLIHAMRPDFVGRTACFREPDAWTRIDSAEVTCSRCIRWIELQQATRVSA